MHSPLPTKQPRSQIDQAADYYSGAPNVLLDECTCPISFRTLCPIQQIPFAVVGHLLIVVLELLTCLGSSKPPIYYILQYYIPSCFGLELLLLAKCDRQEEEKTKYRP